MTTSRHTNLARYLLPAFVLCMFAPRLGDAQNVQGSGAVTIQVDGQSLTAPATGSTVADLLQSAGVALGEHDECLPAPSETVTPGMAIAIRRVTVSTVKQTEPIRARTRVSPTRSLRPGLTMIKQEPKDGLKELTYRVAMCDGVVKNRKLISARVLKPAKDKVIVVGGGQAKLPSRGGYFTGHRTLTMVASGYDPSPRSCGPRANGRTYLGMKARRGIVAVDPRVIPLGARVWVEGYGEAIAGDIGGAIKGNRIDLCFNSYREADRYGLKKVKVVILSD